MAYSNAFTDDPAVYRPVWEFTLSRRNKQSYQFPILVDCLTGKVASSHDGIVDGAYQQDRR